MASVSLKTEGRRVVETAIWTHCIRSVTPSSLPYDRDFNTKRSSTHCGMISVQQVRRLGGILGVLRKSELLSGKKANGWV